MTTPTLPISELPANAQAARLEAEHLWAYTNRLTPWTATRLDDGTISLSAQIRDRAGTLVLAEFASRACTYFEGRPGTPGDQFPALDVSLPGREAVVWRTDGVWVELWHPVPAAPSAPPVRPVPSPRRFLGGRLPVGRYRKTHV
ncbi:hypothetical protein [Streptomyces sp. NPDC059712]|uniref:hypothetical protein n=1 Tax=Streptomyces sp. NPDC059712 TaxID=3346919 RepID=UPI0036A687F7